jgi:hypothetical protein
LSRIETGFLILFPRALAAAPPVIEVVKPESSLKADIPPKAAPAAAAPESPAPGAAIPGRKDDKPPAAAPSPKRMVDPPAAVPAALRPKKIFRITAAADLFLFRDEALAAAYGKSLNWGGRLDVRLFDFGGFWLGLDYDRRSAAGGTRTIRLIPIEAGFKFVMSRGALAPYAGFGATYFLFREETPAGAVSLHAFGLTSTAGILFRLGRIFTFDCFARYRRLPVDLAARSFDAGGFHFGGGIGLTF